MLNAFFVVWRESLEALLIIGILLAWLNVHDADGKGRRALTLGVVAGIGLALALGWALLNVQDELTGNALELFQVGALLLAALLITQMVFWMQRHGREVKTHLEGQLAAAREKRGQWGIAVVAALAIAREGAETVIFLYGLAQGGETAALLTGALGGFAVALLTAWAAAKSLARLNLGLLLKCSSFLLLVLASSLLVAASDRMIGLDWLPTLIDPVWDTSGLLDHNAGFGRLCADFAGYRAQPALSTLLIWGGYWLLVLLPWGNLKRRFFWRKGAPPKQAS
ncbi:MAG: FTR1 family protein [Zoogloeaceae bacterium]|jgi:high-affinity iron transporter|nr:FTR1 family protein [Zoogloeaceae bacterium]